MFKRLILISQLFILSFSLYSEELTLDSFIGKVIDSHPQLKVYASNEETFRLKTESALSQDKWIYSIKPLVNYFGEAASFQYKSSSTTQYGTELSIKTPLGYSGGEVGVSGSSTADFYEPLSNDQGEELYKQSLSVFYKQSLLKNRGLKESKLLEQELIDDYKIVRLNNMELTEKIILEFTNLYLEWVYLDETIKLMNLRVEYSEKLLSQIQSRFTSNLVDEIDILRGREALLNSRQTLLQYNYRKDILVKSLKDKLGIDISGDTPEFEFYKINSEEADCINFREIANNRVFKINSIEKKKLEKTRKRLEISKQSYLDLNVNIGFSSREEDFGSSVSENYLNAGIALSYSGALNNGKTDNSISEIDSRIKSSEHQNNTLTAEYRAESESLFKQLEQTKTLIKAQDELIIIAGKKTEEERKYYYQGRGELNYIIQSLDSETQQKIKKNDQILTLKKICFRLRELSDNLLKDSEKGE